MNPNEHIKKLNLVSALHTVFPKNGYPVFWIF